MSKDRVRSMSIDDFPIKSYDKIRYADTDRQGHVNNAHFSEYLETGRVEILYSKDHPLYTEDTSFVVVNKHVDLIAELNWPGDVEVGTYVKKLGNSSIVFHQGLFQNKMLVAVAETVVVHVNHVLKKSQPLTEKAREVLGQLLLT